MRFYLHFNMEQLLLAIINENNINKTFCVSIIYGQCEMVQASRLKLNKG